MNIKPLTKPNPSGSLITPYDSVRAFEEAFKKATVKTRRDIWNAVPWLHFDGVTGSKTFDEKGNLYSAAYDFFYVNDSAWTKFDTVNIFQPEISLEHGLWKVAIANPTDIQSLYRFHL